MIVYCKINLTRFCHPEFCLSTVFGVALLARCGHAQSPNENLQFQPITGAAQPQQQPSQSSQQLNTHNPQPIQPAAASNQPHVFQGSAQTKPPALQLDGQRFQQIINGSERFALDLFSVSFWFCLNEKIPIRIIDPNTIPENRWCFARSQIQLHSVAVLHLVIVGNNCRGSSWQHLSGTATGTGNFRWLLLHPGSVQAIPVGALVS